MSAKTVDLTISIINHSNPQLLLDCLRSIFSSATSITLDVWVVDNATDQSLVDVIRSEFPNVKWINNSCKKGFSENHNQVLRIAASRYICILNDDTLIQGDAFTKLVRLLDESANIDFAGPRLLNIDGTIQNSAFKKIDMRFFVQQSFPLLGRQSSSINRWIDKGQFGDAICDVDWLLGACIVVRYDCLKTVGLLDEQLSPIANSEDMDWCLRAKNAGLRVCYVPDAQVTHYGGMTLRRLKAGPDKMRVELWRTFIAYTRKHFGFSRACFLRIIVIFSTPWNVVVQTVRHVRHPQGTPHLHDEILTLLLMMRMAAFEWNRAPRR
jgi:GT2 family glycosyltransferase